MDPIILEQMDQQAQQILADFVPDKVFDTHAHIYAETPDSFRSKRRANKPLACYDLEAYLQCMARLLPGRTVQVNMFPSASDKNFVTNRAHLLANDAFIAEQLEKDPLNTAEIIVLPGESVESLESRLIHPRMRGFKCYYSLVTDVKDPNLCYPEEFLPESAWEIANERGMVITLHLSRPYGLSDPANLTYIKTMAQRYPNAILILAHAARGYTSWTTVEAVDQIAHLDNVWYDLSAIFESPAPFQILNKVGVSRCMWGTDFPICTARTKCVGLGLDYSWLGDRILDVFGGHNWDVGTQTLMAIRQACIMADLTPSQVEDLFYNNATRLFHGK